jgi:hypothetical protein
MHHADEPAEGVMMTSTTAPTHAPAPDPGSTGVGTLLHLVTSLAAWAFILVTLVNLSWLAMNHAPAGTSTILRDGDLTSLGLTYVGPAGTALLWGQIVVIGGAAIASACRVPLLRQAALVLLAGWATLWAGNALRLALVGTNTSMWWPLAVGYTAGTVACVARTRLDWRRLGTAQD